MHQDNLRKGMYVSGLHRSWPHRGLSVSTSRSRIGATRLGPRSRTRSREASLKGRKYSGRLCRLRQRDECQKGLTVMNLAKGEHCGLYKETAPIRNYVKRPSRSKPPKPPKQPREVSREARADVRLHQSLLFLAAVGSSFRTQNSLSLILDAKSVRPVCQLGDEARGARQTGSQTTS